MNPIFERLGAKRLFDDPEPAPDPDLLEFLDIELPEHLLTLLLEIRGAVFFGKQALFKPLEPCGAEDEKGYASIDLLFGWSKGTYGLKELNRPRDWFPDNLVAIADTLGGDRICLDRDTMEVVRWDHEGDEEDAVTLIAHDFDSFIASLKTGEEVEAEG